MRLRQFQKLAKEGVDRVKQSAKLARQELAETQHEGNCSGVTVTLNGFSRPIKVEIKKIEEDIEGKIVAAYQQAYLKASQQIGNQAMPTLSSILQNPSL